MWKGSVELPGSLCSHVEYTVKMGDTQLQHTSARAVTVPVKDIVIHQYFNPVGLIENDIALALLAFPVNFSASIQPVCLPEKAFMVQAGTECWVTGWGQLKEDGETGRQGLRGKSGALGLASRLKGGSGRLVGKGGGGAEAAWE